MKKIKNYFKVIVLLIGLGLAGKGEAQCLLSAGFSYTYGNNGAVNFQSTSTGTIQFSQFYWNFGDGTFTSQTQIPSHNFPANGTYTVTLTVSNFTNAPACADTISQIISVTNITCNINANYSAAQSSNGLVNFSNVSTGTVSGVTYQWNFGDGSTSNSPSPAHTFSANGIYNISMTANNNYTFSCTSTKTSTIYINSFCTYTPSFTPTYQPNGIVILNSTTSNLMFDTWNFGDGSPQTWPYQGSTPVNHTYQNGSYMVSLTVTNYTNGPTCSINYTQMINVTSYTCNLNASFTHSAIANFTVPNLVYFDASATTGINGNTRYSWKFGDGATAGPSTGPYTSHAYASAGPYNATLVVSDISTPSCKDSTSASVTASVICIASASFTLFPSGTPLQWIVIPSAPGNVIAATWNWGDGSSSNTLYTSHSYSAAGTYTLCLTVTVSCGATNSFCSSYFVFRGGGSNEMIGITVIEPGTTGIKNVSASKSVFTIYPNPGNGLINISASNSGFAKILIYDVLGNVIYNEATELSADKVKMVELQNASDGIYFVKMISGEKNFTEKIVISK